MPQTDPSPEELLRCPKCNSTQLEAFKNGYSLKKGLAGLVFLPGGILWGLHGRNKIKIACLGCGRMWKPGQLNKNNAPPPTKPTAQDMPAEEIGAGCILLVLLIAFLCVFIYIKACR